MIKREILILLSVAFIIIFLVCACDKTANQGSADTKSTITENSSENITESSSSAAREKFSVEDRGRIACSIPGPDPVVGAAQGTDYESGATKTAIENAGGLGNIIRKGDTVLIKPNITDSKTPEQAVVTDYRVVRDVINEVFALGAAKVIIGESTGNGKTFNYEPSGYPELLKTENVEYVDFNDCKESDCYQVKAQNSNTDTTFSIPKVYMDADVVISIAKMKTHTEGVVTLTLKNSFGVPPVSTLNLNGTSQYKSRLHELGVHNSIVDLNKIRKPDFAIIDGILAGEGQGPINVTPVKANIVFAGIDPVAVDTVGLTFMGFTADEVPHVKMAGEQGLGINDLSKITVNGVDLEKAKMKFVRAR